MLSLFFLVCILVVLIQVSTLLEANRKLLAELLATLRERKV